MIRKLVISAALIAAGATAQAGPLSITEGFDNIGTLGAAGWLAAYGSTPPGETGWFQGNSGIFGASSGAADSYIAANYLNAGPGGSVDTWLVSPVVTVLGYTGISFDTRTAGGFPGDNLEVYYNNSGTLNIADFVLLGSVTSASYPVDWANFDFTYIAGAGPVSADVRFAFRYTVKNTDEGGDYIGIDSVNIRGVPEPEALGILAAGLLLMPLALRRRRKTA
jgi:hypothetical protein